LERNDVDAPIAADHQTDTKLSDYNSIAIDNAATLHKFRQSTQQLDRADLPIEQLVPAFNPTAAGAYREYEQMGDRPVSEGLKQRSADQGIEFEHPASLSAPCSTAFTSLC
jgi:hypothetical protein